MHLRSEQLKAHLERELKPIYAVYGDEPLLVIEVADAIRAKARQRGFDEREVLTAITGFNWSELAQAASNLSLFGSRKLIDLRIPTGKPGREGSAALVNYCKNPSPDAVLLVTLPGLNWTDEKAVWVKTLVEAGVVLKPQPPSSNELPNWIAMRLKQQQQSAEQDALRFIAERVEGNLLAAHQEILKLGLLYLPGSLSLAQIKEAVSNVARYDLDGLREALLAGDVVRLTRTLEGLQQEGEALPLVLWAMTEEVRALAIVKAGEKNHPLDKLLKEARIWGERQAPFKRALQRVSGASAAAALAHAAEIDRLLKGIGHGDVWNEFLRLGLRLAKH